MWLLDSGYGRESQGALRPAASYFSRGEIVLRKPTLLRYYGLTWLLVFAALVVSILAIIAKGYQLEWLYEWGVNRIGFLCIGVCSLLRGLDFIVFHRRYPSFLAENAPGWDARAHWASPMLLLWAGVWSTLGGAGMAATGGWYLIQSMLETLQN